MVGDSFGKTRASDVLDLPPVMKRSVGNPVVHAAEPENRTLKLRLPKLRRTVSDQSPAGVANQLLERFWTKHLESCAGEELISLTRERFFRIGQGQLLGKPIDDSLGNAWWKVRMGMPTTEDPEHHLISMATKSPEKFYRHSVLGVRHRGGQKLDQDYTLDFRVLWDTDRDPSMKDWMNKDGALKLNLNVVPFADWLYTQTHFRGLEVEMRFLEISKEQHMIIDSYSKASKKREFGEFKALRSNCATRGFETLNRLVPIGQEFCQTRLLGDRPIRLLNCGSKGFREVAIVMVPSRAEENGIKPSHRSTFRKAPDPTALPGIRQLAAVAEIN